MHPNYTTKNTPSRVKDNKAERDRLFAVDLSAGLKALRQVSYKAKYGGAGSADPEPEIDRVKVADLLRAGGDSDAAFRYEFCHQDGMGFVGVCLADPTHEGLYHPFSCNDRACPVCSRRRSAELSSQITKPITDLAARAPRGYGLRHLVLTTSVSLFDDADQVRRCVATWRTGIRVLLQDHFARRDSNGRVTKDSWLGGLIGVEFGESGRKLHFHVLLLSRFVHMDSILAKWRDLTGGLGYIGKVRAVDSDAAGAIDEVCKYATKAMRFDGESASVEETLARVHFVLKGVRRLQGFGVFYRMAREDIEIDLVCPECGSPVMWIDEITWMIAQADGRASLDLTPVNKLLGSPARKGDRPPARAVQGALEWPENG